MKKNLLIGFIFLTIGIQSQVVFSPPGAEWTYNYKLTMGGAPGAPTYLEKIKYSRDSILGNDTVKVLTHNRFFLECSSMSVSPTLIKQSGDTIFMRNFATNHSWQILYNFNCMPGQSWETVMKIDIYNSNPPQPLCTYTVTVDSISSVSENGFNLKRLHVQYKRPSFNSYPGYITKHPAIITERYGCGAFMFNYYNNTFGMCDHDWFTRFLCYNDSQFGNKQFTSYPCDFRDPLSVSGNADMAGMIQVYPNPVQQTIRINVNTVEDYKVVITNGLGEKIYTFKYRDALNEVDLSTLNSGIYFLNVYSKQGLIGIKKFVKE